MRNIYLQVKFIPFAGGLFGWEERKNFCSNNIASEERLSGDVNTKTHNEKRIAKWNIRQSTVAAHRAVCAIKSYATKGGEARWLHG